MEMSAKCPFHILLCLFYDILFDGFIILRLCYIMSMEHGESVMSNVQFKDESSLNLYSIID